MARFDAVVNGELFTTKAALTARCRGMLQGEIDQPFLYSLLQRHSKAVQKIGCGVRHFDVRVNQPFGTRGFWIVRVDGTETDFSYIACISPPSKEADALKAMRNAIHPQILAFKQWAFAPTGMYNCALTGQRIAFSSSHVDHKPPRTFDALVQSFLSSYQFKLSDIEVNDTLDGDIETCMKDGPTKELWQTFHQTYAILQITSAAANLSQGRGKGK